MIKKSTKNTNYRVWNSRSPHIPLNTKEEYLIKYKQMKRRRNAFGLNIGNKKPNENNFLPTGKGSLQYAFRTIAHTKMDDSITSSIPASNVSKGLKQFVKKNNKGKIAGIQIGSLGPRVSRINSATKKKSSTKKKPSTKKKSSTKKKRSTKKKPSNNV